jgi:hypothetical protein
MSWFTRNFNAGPFGVVESIGSGIAHVGDRIFGGRYTPPPTIQEMGNNTGHTSNGRNLTPEESAKHKAPDGSGIFGGFFKGHDGPPRNRYEPDHNNHQQLGNLAPPPAHIREDKGLPGTVVSRALDGWFK